MVDSGLIYSHDFIPDNEIWLKVGEDHEDESFEMASQISNVQHPNAPGNTAIFSIMEAKEYKTNLRLYLERFRTHISHFNKVPWRGKTFRIILFWELFISV